MILRLLLLALLLLPSLVFSVERYVSKGGYGDSPSDGNSCTASQTITTPKLTLGSALACMTTPGDMLFVRGGTYPEGIDGNTMAIPTGTLSARMTVQCYNGESVTLPKLGLTGAAAQYLIVDCLNVDGGGTTIETVSINSGAGHLIIKNARIHHAQQFGVLLSSTGVGDNTLRNLEVDTNGVSAIHHHGIYLSGSSNNVVEGCRVHNNAAYGIHLYNDPGETPNNNNTLRNNTIYTNGSSAAGSAGLLIREGNDNLAYNNLIYDNQAGLVIANGGQNAAYNNTLYANNGSGANCCYAGIEVTSAAVSSQVQNNLVVQHTAGAINNVGVASNITSNFVTNPGFVNAGAGNFRLQACAPSGTCPVDWPSSVDLGTIFTSDLDGTARLQGSRWDPGAYEFGAPPPPAQLAFTTQPTTTPTNQTMAAVVVQAQDISGNLASGYSDNVTVALATGSVPVPFAGTSLVSVDSFDPGFDGARAIDGNTGTMWHTQFTGGNPVHPHQIIVNLGASYTVNGFQYLPRTDSLLSGTFGQYEFFVSATGGTCPGAAWGTATATGTLAYDHTLKQVAATQKTGQYVCLRALNEGGGNPWTSIAELTMLYNPGGASGQLLGPPVQPAISGIATFANLSINAPGTYTLIATATGLSTATSATFAIGTGPTHLRFTQQPQTSLVGQIMQAFTVQFEDSANNVINTTQAIAIAFGTNPGGSLLAGTVTRPAVAGVATFNDLAITNVGGVGYTFVASAMNTTPATSAPFTILGQPPVSREWVATRASAYQCAESGGDTNVSAFADTALIPQANLSLVAVDSANAGYGGALAIDGDDLTFWHTEFDSTSPPHPHSIIVDLGASYTVTAFQHLRRQDGDSSQVGGGILGYQFYVSPTVMSLPCSANGGTAVASGTMPDVQTTSTIQTTPKVGRYVCLVALSEVEGNPWTSMAEMRVFQSTGVGSGAAYVHTLACAIRAGDLRAQGLLHTCALLNVATVGAASTAILELHLGNIVLNTNAGASITQTLTSNSWVCFDTVIGANPGSSVPTYSSYLQTAPSFARITGRGGITPQPVNVDTTVAEIAAFASRWLSSTGGDDSISLNTMTMGVSK